MTKLEQKLIELGYWEKIDNLWTTKTSKVFFKDLDLYTAWYIGFIIDIEKEKIALHFVRNDNPPHVYQDREFDDLFEIHSQYKSDLKELKEYDNK